MTDQEISKLSPTDINEAVARKLGWEYTPPAEGSDGYWKRHYTKNPRGTNQFPFLDDYCSSIEAAWEIVTKNSEIAGFRFVLSSTKDNKWVAKWVTYSMGEEMILYDGEPNEGYAKADTAPMAICKAFLKMP